MIVVAALVVPAVLAVAVGPTQGPQGLAGSRAGVGRAHPGRGLDGAPTPVEQLAPHAAAPVLITPGAGPARRPGGETGGGLVLEVLPLGLGLTLMGAGLGFIGLRLRRRG